MRRLALLRFLAVSIVSLTTAAQPVPIAEGALHVTLPSGFTRPVREALSGATDGVGLLSVDPARKISVLLSVEHTDSSMARLALRIAQENAKREWPRIVRDEEFELQGYCGLTTVYEKDVPRMAVRTTAVVISDSFYMVTVVTGDPAQLASPEVSAIFASMVVDGNGAGCSAGAPTAAAARAPATRQQSASSSSSTERELLGDSAADVSRSVHPSPAPAPPPPPEPEPRGTVAETSTSWEAPTPAPVVGAPMKFEGSLLPPPDVAEVPLFATVNLLPGDRARNWPLHKMNMHHIANIAERERSRTGSYPDVQAIEKVLHASIRPYRWEISEDHKSYRVISPGDSRRSTTANEPKGATNDEDDDFIFANGVFTQWYDRDVRTTDALLAAAKAGDATAAKELGSRYESAYGVAADHDAAIRWYRQAAAAGDEDAREWLKALEHKD
jgi:hypothetical protein